MPYIEVNGVRLHYVEHGSGPEAIVFSHSYLVDWSHFKPQIDALSGRYRCIAFDHRGHGASERPKDGYDMENLYADAVAFIEAMKCAPLHFVGLSKVGHRSPTRISPARASSLAHADGYFRGGRASTEETPIRADDAHGPPIGIRPFAPYIMSLFFSKKSRRDLTREAELGRFRQMLIDNDKDAIIQFGRGIFDREGVLERLAEIAVPSLVIVGEEDKSQPPPARNV